MFNLKTISITRGNCTRLTKSSLNKVAIRKQKTSNGYSNSGGNRQSIFKYSPTFKRLHANIKVIRHHGKVLTKLERKPYSQSFIDRSTEISAVAQCALHDVINVL